MDHPAFRLARRLPDGGAVRNRMAAGLVARLSRAGSPEGRDPLAPGGAFTTGSTALRVELHAVQDLPRLRLVLLYFLVPGIPRECPLLQHGLDRQVWMDPVHGSGNRQSIGWMGLRDAAQAGLDGDARAQD